MSVVVLGACGASHDRTTTSTRSAQTGHVSEEPAAARPRDTTRTYSGDITSATGRYAKASGSMAITLTLTQTGTSPHPPHRLQPRYAVSVGLHGARCKEDQRLGATHLCLALSGTIDGSAIEEQPIPPIGDLPTKIRIVTASGRISSLGAVVAKGEMIGVGFIRKGRRSLSMTLAARSGTVSVKGVGPLVPGFTPP
jgi:hypothetical protein